MVSGVKPQLTVGESLQSDETIEEAIACSNRVLWGKPFNDYPFDTS